MDTNIQRMRETNKAVAILSTDLLAAFDTVDTVKLIDKLDFLYISIACILQRVNMRR